MIEKELIITGLLLSIVFLLLIILWRIETTVCILKKQVKILSKGNTAGEEVIIQGDRMNANDSSENMLSKKQCDEAGDVETGGNTIHVSGVNDGTFVDIMNQKIVKGIGEKRENEELINEVLSEIFS